MKRIKLGTLTKALAAVKIEEPKQVWIAVRQSVEPEFYPQTYLDRSFGRKAQKELKFAAASKILKDVKVMASAGIGKAVTEYYAKTSEFLWINSSGMPNARARSTTKFLADSEAWGLTSSDYQIDDPISVEGDPDTTLLRAVKFEIDLTAKIVQFISDAQHGKVNPNKISGYHDFPANKPNYGKIVAGLTKAKLPAAYLAQVHPKSPSFQTMKSELARLRGENDSQPVVKIKSGTFVKPGQVSNQLAGIIAAIKARGSTKLLALHEVTLTEYDGAEIYSDNLVKLVKGFQAENKLGADGIIGRRTIAKLKGISAQDKIDRVLYAMERLRWLPTSLGSTHVFINQPAYRASYIRDGKVKLSMRAIVGKKSNQTSFFHDTIESVVYNPYWGVPRSILVNEFLPKLRANPSYLDERGYEVTDRRGQQIASANVDWWSVGSKPPYDVRQTPGPKNALGELKILFPNKHAIYMHDTPSRGLFKRSARALSHGCVRLHKPRAMAAAVLGTNISHITKKLAGGHSKQSVRNKIPVYVAYFTAWPKENGQMGYYGDIYGRDLALAKALRATSKSRQAAVTG